MLLNYHDEYKIYYREPSNDLEIYKDVQKYKVPFKDKRVLDIGAHAGYFAHYAISQGASEVICYEPEKDNHKLLELNQIKGKMRLHKKAVMGYNNSRLLKLYVNDSFYNTGSPSVIVFGSNYQIVRNERIGKVLMQHKPHIVKIDVEGAEYNIIDNIRCFFGIEYIIVDYHFFTKNADSLYEHCNQKLLREFEIVKECKEQNYMNCIYKRVNR